MRAGDGPRQSKEWRTARTRGRSETQPKEVSVNANDNARGSVRTTSGSSRIAFVIALGFVLYWAGRLAAISPEPAPARP